MSWKLLIKRLLFADSFDHESDQRVGSENKGNAQSRPHHGIFSFFN